MFSWRQKPKLRKWYFAANGAALAFSFDQIVASVTSARLNTSLQPFALIDVHDVASHKEQLAWLEDQGVVLVRHRASLFQIVAAYFGQRAIPFNGHWLRCDLPEIERDEQIVLYTDIDVIFRRDVFERVTRPSFLACAPEFERGNHHYFNSGVMVLNVPRLRREAENIRRRLQERLSIMDPWDDQGLFNDIFRGRSDWLSDEWNWKPYWGWSEQAAIVHFHGLKPGLAKAYLDYEPGLPRNDEYERMLTLSRDGYTRYIQEFSSYVDKGSRGLAIQRLI